MVLNIRHEDREMNKSNTPIPESAPPVWDNFLDEILSGEPEKLRELQRYLGLMLWPEIMRARGSS